jgi:phage-related protein
MKKFDEWLNESEESLAFPSFIPKMEKEGECKALPLQYVFFFEDEEINDALQVTYNTGTEKFSVDVKGAYFRGEEFNCDNYLTALNYVKLYMISQEYGDAQIVDELKWVITKKPLKFSQLADAFYDRIVKSKMEISQEAMKALGITDNVKNSNRYGI